MVKILSSEQIKNLDAFTIKQEQIASIDLMERACRSFVQWFVSNVDVSKKTGIVCGTGNNGGDGLGIARMLHDWGYQVKIWVIKGSAPETEDFKINLKKIQEKSGVLEISKESDCNLIKDTDILIDGIFGSGLSRPVEGIYARAIQVMNESNALKIAIDIPSGLMADKSSSGIIIKADYTISFQLPKLSFFLPQSFEYTGEWVLADIGLNKDFIKEAETRNFYLSKKDACKILKPRERFAHKGNFGHALLIAGSYGKMGAAVLSARAILRAGAGLVTVHAPGCGFEILQTAVPEAMFSKDKNENFISAIDNAEKFTSIGIGPGLGQNPETIKALQNLMEKFRRPMVLDADALNILAANKDLFHLIPEGSILTPHPKEFERLSGKWENDFERLQMQTELAGKLKSFVIVKGAFSTTAAPSGNIYFNSTGNPGMATGGTGDVLTGILTGLLAQDYDGEKASILGVYLHGLAGDLAAVDKGTDSLIGTDLIEYLPQAFKNISRR